MTDAKKLKKTIRARAEKTGEKYAVARTHVLSKLEREREAKTLSTAKKARGAKATGTVSEARCIEKTGHGFDYWFGKLDRFGAAKKGHTAAAKHLKEDLGVSAWYSQSITVAYERAKGLRDVGQACTGEFQTSVSRVLPVSAAKARTAIARKTERAKWLDTKNIAGAGLEAALTSSRMQTRGEMHRIRYRPGSGTVEVELRPKDDGRVSFVVRHFKLDDKAEMEELRVAWREVADALKNHLKG